MIEKTKSFKGNSGNTEEPWIIELAFLMHTPVGRYSQNAQTLLY